MEVVSLRKLSIDESRAIWLARKTESHRPVKLLALVGILAFAAAFTYASRVEATKVPFADVIVVGLAAGLIGAVLASGPRKSDFLDGYGEGVSAGVNRVLQITQEDEVFIQEVMHDAQGAQEQQAESSSI